jgi:hypothetical protein
MSNKREERKKSFRKERKEKKMIPVFYIRAISNVGFFSPLGKKYDLIGCHFTTG